ncbi:MAG: lipopolysaccharide biosynthesis [Bryobacterales bacterium]|nr:lipopolysaccharide biosynthesis [Bryobacterales bacterium]
MIPSQQYPTISRRALDVEDYIDIVRRHTSWIMGPLFAGLVISCVVAFMLPNTYVSSAVLRISPAQVSETLIPSTVSQQMNERIAQMQQQILSRTSLSDLIQNPTLNLYRRERDSQPLEDVIERMRSQDIRINIVNLPGQGSRPASAFSISYAYNNRFKAQLVVQALITKFMESMVNVQRDQGKVTADFLTDEIAKARTELNRLDTEITQFRVQNAGHLPEELQVNMQALNGLQMQVSAVNQGIQRNAEDKMTLETNLNTLKMQRDISNEMNNTSAESTVSRVHNERLAFLNREIGDLEARFTQLQALYTEKHPYIRDARTQLQIKKAERDQLQAKEDQEAAKPKPPPKVNTNPLVAQRVSEIQGAIDMVQTQLRNKENERLTLLKNLDQLNKTIATYQSRIALVPANQQKYIALAREHELVQQHYLELQRTESKATTFDDVGKHKAGENLEVLDNASLPEAPTAPNRWLITGIGVGLGVVVGIFLTGIKEMKDTSLKNLKDVRAYTNLPILSSIPLLENDLLERRKRRLSYVGWSAAVILGIVAMSGSMYYHFYVLTS